MRASRPCRWPQNFRRTQHLQAKSCRRSRPLHILPTWFCLPSTFVGREPGMRRLRSCYRLQFHPCRAASYGNLQSSALVMTTWLRRKRFMLGRILAEIRDRFEAVVAGVAMPEECSSAAGKRLDPVRHADRLAALRAGILLGHGGSGCSGHGALPFLFYLIRFI